MAKTTIWGGATDGNPLTTTNWTGGTPVTGDTAIVPADATVDIDGGDQSAVALAQLIIEPGCDIDIGTEALPWTIDVTNTNGILETSGEGSIWLTSDITLAQIRAAGSGADDGQYKLNLVSRTAAGIVTTEIRADSGQSIGIAANAGESAYIDTVRVHGGDVTLGLNLTAVTTDMTLQVGGGDVICHDTIDIVKLYGGEIEMFGTISDLLETYGGRLYYRGTGTTAVATFIDGVLDCSRDMRARTLTAAVKYANAEIIDPYKTLAFGADGLSLEGCDHEKVDRGKHYGVVYTAIP